ncbi:MAG: hypothetical protein GY847_27055 [Proteobacteria bacterium]|nr:hypothetical protein [Pseudomonadota bacterium]
MTESRKKRTQTVAKPELEITGILRMPEEILLWELELLGPILAALQDANVHHVQSDTGVKDNGQ